MDIKPIKICVRFFISDTLRKSFKQKHIIILMSVVFNCLLFSNLFQHSLINAQTMRLVNSKTGHWKALGPIYPVVSTEVGTGRVTCVAISPSNSRTLFIGTPGAGIWKSTDEGVSWNRFKNVPYKNLSIYDIEFDPINSRHIIACTGDPDRKHGFSYGLLETFNGGESWVVNPVNFENGSNLVEDADIFFLYKILFIPDSDNLIRRDTITRNLYLSTYYIESGNTMNGSFYSTNFGLTWQSSQVSNSSNKISFKIVKQNRSNTNYLLAFNQTKISGKRNFYYSRDVGRTFDKLNITLPEYTVGTINFYENESDSIILFLNRNENLLNHFCVSDLAGNISRIYENNIGRSHSEYKMQVIMNPRLANEIIWSGKWMYKSTDSGINWNSSTYYYEGINIHGDIHFLRYDTRSDRLYACTDGGIFKSTNFGNSWSSINSRLNIAQSYNIAVYGDDEETLVVSGNQDCATNLLKNNIWEQISGGDGGGCAFNETGNLLFTTMYSERRVYRISIESGEKITVLDNSILNSNGFIDNSSNSLYEIALKYKSGNLSIGYNNLYLSTNNGNNFRQFINPDDTRIKAICIINRSSILFGTEGGHIYKLNLGDNTISEIAFLENQSITGISFDYKWPDFESNAYIWYCSNSKVYRCNINGDSIKDYTPKIDSSEYNEIICSNIGIGGIYLATSEGVLFLKRYKKIGIENYISNWISYNKDLPKKLKINDLAINYSNKTIYAGSFGMGIFASPLYNEKYFDWRIPRETLSFDSQDRVRQRALILIEQDEYGDDGSDLEEPDEE